METDAYLVVLVAAIILSIMCAILGHARSQSSVGQFASVLILGGLGIGAIIVPDPYQNVFLLSVIGYGGYQLSRNWDASLAMACSLGQLALAALFCMIGMFTVDSVHVLAQVMLAVTFLPFAPFHFPFVTVLQTSSAPLVGHWVVVWLAIGLSQLAVLRDWLPFEEVALFQVMLLGSGAYALLKALGLRSITQSLAYITIALLALLWGLLPLFAPQVSWVFLTGLGIGFLVGALLLAYSFLYQRYGIHEWIGLQGLGSGMPRFRALVTLVISLAMSLPILPIVLGLSGTSMSHTHGGSLVFPILTWCIVWMGASWHWSRILDQMAFGIPRADIEHEDLHVCEMIPIGLLSVATGLCSLLL